MFALKHVNKVGLVGYLFALFIVAAVVAQNSYHGFTEPSDWTAQSGGKTFKAWYAPNDPANPIAATLTHGRSSGFSTAIYRPESYGAKYDTKTVAQAKANSTAITNAIAAMPDTGGTLVIRDELYTWGAITNPTRTIQSSSVTIPFGLHGESDGRSAIINLNPDTYAIQWANSASVPFQDVDGHSPMLLADIRVISQGGGILLTGLGKLLEVRDIRVSRCHGTGITCSALYGGSLMNVYAVANYGKGVDIDSCNALHIDLITRRNTDDGVEITGCTGIYGSIYAEGEYGWGINADALNNSSLDIYVEGNRTIPPFVATVNHTNNDFTKTAHGLVNQQPVTFATYGTIATPLNPATTYYVTNAAANTFQVSTTVNGAALDLTTNGTGDQYCKATLIYEQPQARFQNCFATDLRGWWWQDRGYGLDLDKASFIGVRQQRDPDWPAGTALSLGATLAEHGGMAATDWDNGFRPSLVFDDADTMTFTAVPGTYNHATNDNPPANFIILFDTVLAAVNVTAGDWVDLVCDIELDAAASTFFRANPKAYCMKISLDGGAVFTVQPQTNCYHYHSIGTLRFHARSKATSSGSGLVCRIFPYGTVEDDGNDGNVPSVGHSIKVHNVKVHKISQ